MTEIPGHLRVAIRTDAAHQIGTGHVMRGLTLAEALRDRGAEVYFICRELPGHLGGVLADQGYPVQWLPAPAAERAAIPAHTAPSTRRRWIFWKLSTRPATKWPRSRTRICR